MSMALAPAVSTRVVTGRAIKADGTPATGNVEFISSLTQLDAVDNVVIIDSVITAPVDRNTGDWAITVPATDDPDLEPGILVYTVRIPGARSVRTITVPAGAGVLRYVDAQDSVIVPAAMIGVALTGLTIGRVDTLPPGSLGTAEIVGGPPEPELNLGIPQGPKGDRPVIELGTVTTGAPGSSVIISWTGVGSIAAPYIVSFTIPRGDVGAPGPVGPSPEFAAPTATKLAPGSNPTITKSGAGTAASPLALTFGLVTGDKGDKGDPGDSAGAIDDTTPSTGTLYSSAKVETLLVRGAPLGPQRNCVIVGSSNATVGSWTGTFCTAWGLTEKNFAVGGSGYTTNPGFLAQLQNAAADASFANSSVGVVVICDASNDIRARVAVPQADAAISYARTTFPNARVLVLPVIWPADPSAQVTGVPGGWQSNWHEWLLADCYTIQTAAAKYGAEYVDQSWTWLTGLTGVMEASGGVHPNATGYGLIAQWLGKHLRGESTRANSPWVQATFLGDVAADVNLRRLSAQREGWLISIEGGLIKPTAGSGGLTDLAQLPIGFRPPISAEIIARYNGSAAPKVVTIYPNGTMRLWENVPANTPITFAGTLRYG